MSIQSARLHLRKVCVCCHWCVHQEEIEKELQRVRAGEDVKMLPLRSAEGMTTVLASPTRD